MAINIPANINLQVSGSRPLGKLTGDLNQFESSLRAANARVLAFGASTAIIAGITKSFKDLAATTIQVQKSFTDINRILSVTDSTFNKFGSDIFRIAKQTATGFDDVAKAALEFSRQGLSVEEVSKRTADALTLVRLTGIDAEKSVSLLTATVNAFSNLDTTKALNKFVAVETKFAVSAGNLIEGLSRVGSAATDAKVSFDELNALITAVQQTTGRGGAVIGNALKTIFTRLQRQSTLEQLERFNIGVRDIEGNILPAVRILENFAKAYDGLSDSTQAYLREQVAGVFQANNLSAILKDLNKEQSITAKSLEVSKNATNEAALANEKLNRSLSALLAQSSTEVAQLQANIGKVTFEPLAKSVTKIFVDSLEQINKVISTPQKDLESAGEQFGGFLSKGILKGLSNLLLPATAGIFTVLAVVAKRFLKDLAAAVPAYLGLETQAAKRLQLEQNILRVLQQQNEQTKKNTMLSTLPANKRQAAGVTSMELGAESASAMKEQRRIQDIQSRIALGGVGSSKGMVSAFGNVAGSLVGGALSIDPKASASMVAKANQLSSALAVGVKDQQKFNAQVKRVAQQYGVNYNQLLGQIRNASKVNLAGVVSQANPNFKKIQIEASKLAGSINRGSIQADVAALEMKEFAISLGMSSAQATKIANRMLLMSQQADQAAKGGFFTRLSRRMGGMGGRLGLGLATGLPMVAGLAEQAIFSDTPRSKLSGGERIFKSGLANVSSYASVGGTAGFIMGGPAGAAAGAAAGAIAGLAQAALNANLSLDELAEVTEEYANKTKEDTSLANQYIEAVRKLNDPALSGQARLEAQKKFQEVLEKVSKSDLPERFKSAGRNVTELASSLKLYEKERRRGEVIRGLGTKGAQLQLLQRGFTSAAGAPTGGSAAITSAEAYKFFDKETIASITPAFGEFFGYFADAAGKISPETAQKLNKIVKDNSGGLFGFDEEGLAKDLQSAFPDTIGLGDIEILSEQFKKFGNEELIKLFEMSTSIVEEYYELLNGEVEVEELERSLIRTKQRLTNITRQKGATSFDQKIRDSYDQLLSSIQDQISTDLKLTAEQLVRRRFGNQLAQLGQTRSQAEAAFSLKNISGLQTAFDQAKFTQSDPALQAYERAMADFVLNPDQALADLRSDISKGIFQGEDIDKLQNYVADLSETRRQELVNLQYEENVLRARQEIELQRAKNTDKLATLGFLERSGQFQARINQVGTIRPMQRELANLESQRGLISSSPFLNAAEKFEQTQKLDADIFKKQREIEAARQKFELDMFDAQKSFERERLSTELSLADAQVRAQGILTQALNNLAEVIANPASIIEQAKKNVLNDRYERYKSDFEGTKDVDKRRALTKSFKEDQKLINDRYSQLQETTGYSPNKTGSTSVSAFRGVSDSLSQVSVEMSRLQILTDQERELIVKTFGEDGIDALNNFKEKQKAAQQEFENVRGAGSFTRGLEKGFNNITDDVDTFRFTLGEEIPDMFANNMANALNQAMDGAEDLGDALRGAAIGFLTEIRNQLTANAVKGLISGTQGLFSSDYSGITASKEQRGGFIHAQNGMYISGNRYGDRNPALLEDGEYVLNRNAVRALGGPNSIDQLNFGMAPRFQSGGSAFINEPMGSSRLSGLFYASDDPALQEARDAARARYEERQRKKAESKALRNAFISALAMGAFSGVSGYIQDQGGLGEMFKNKGSGADPGGELEIQKGGYINSGARNIDSIPAFMAGGEFVMNNKAVRKYGLGFMSRLNGGYIPTYQSGGSVAESPAPTLNAMGGGSTNNINISVNMGGSQSGEASSGSLGNGQDGGDDTSNAEELSKRIEAAVVKVIQKEQRVGGLLTEGGRKNN